MNEYHEKFKELQDKSTFKGQQWFGERQRLVEKYAWAVPSEEAVFYLAEFEELIEVGAGSGYWASCIEEAGGSVEAYDIDPPEDTYHEVQRPLNLESGGDIHNRPLLMVWPPCHNNMSSRAAKEGPSHILYVGEPRGGCTANEKFFEVLDERYGLVAKVNIPSYAGIDDDLFHYVRKL